MRTEWNGWAMGRLVGESRTHRVQSAKKLHASDSLYVSISVYWVDSSTCQPHMVHMHMAHGSAHDGICQRSFFHRHVQRWPARCWSQANALRFICRRRRWCVTSIITDIEIVAELSAPFCWNSFKFGPQAGDDGFGGIFTLKICLSWAIFIKWDVYAPAAHLCGCGSDGRSAGLFNNNNYYKSTTDRTKMKSCMRCTREKIKPKMVHKQSTSAAWWWAKANLSLIIFCKSSSISSHAHSEFAFA